MCLSDDGYKMSLEMPIPPKSRGEIVWLSILTAVVIFFVFFAVFDLSHREAIIPSVLWLALVTFGIREEIKRTGSFRKFATEVGGALAGREFVEITSPGGQPAEIQFGFELFGRRHIQRAVLLDKVQTVQWRPGQGTAMSGRDMKDWSVALWFTHDHPTERSPWKPGQYVHIVGPSRRREDTEILGLALVDILRSAGVPLARGHQETSFVRS
jgi:hypothetical protein